MVVDSILPHAECGPNDHRKDAPRLYLNAMARVNQNFKLFDWAVVDVSIA